MTMGYKIKINNRNLHFFSSPLCLNSRMSWITGSFWEKSWERMNATNSKCPSDKTSGWLKAKDRIANNSKNCLCGPKLFIRQKKTISSYGTKYNTQLVVPIGYGRPCCIPSCHCIMLYWCGRKRPNIVGAVSYKRGTTNTFGRLVAISVSRHIAYGKRTVRFLVIGKPALWDWTSPKNPSKRHKDVG